MARDEGPRRVAATRSCDRILDAFLRVRTSVAVESGVVDRVKQAGVKGASPVDLIAVGFSRREDDADAGEGMSQKILKRFGSLKALGQASASDIKELSGLEGFESLRIEALVELGRRIGRLERGPDQTVDSVDDVSFRLDYLRDEKKEHFVAILLDAKNHILRVAEIHIGTLSMSLVGPREVFREAIREGASSIIVAHNHPSGDPSPSREDIEITRTLVQVGNMLDIPVLDHVIIGAREDVSLKQRGLVAG